MTPFARTRPRRPDPRYGVAEDRSPDGPEEQRPCARCQRGRGAARDEPDQRGPSCERGPARRIVRERPGPERDQRASDREREARWERGERATWRGGGTARLGGEVPQASAPRPPRAVEGVGRGRQEGQHGAAPERGA